MDPLLGLVLLTTATALAVAPRTNLVDRLPAVVRDQVTVLDDYRGGIDRWTATSGATLSVVPDPDRKTPCLVIRLGADQAQLEYGLWPGAAPNKPLGERLRFWLKSDRAGPVLKVARRDATPGEWVDQAEVTLRAGWQHIEVAACNPVYAFYGTTIALRFTVTGAAGGTLRVGRLEWVSPGLVPPKRQTIQQAGRIFTSWGGPSKQQIAMGAQVGSTFHFTPMAFPDGDREAFTRGVDAVAERARWCHEAGIQAGIQFYNNPPRAFADAHRDLFPFNQKGVSYYDYYAGGAGLSPWNPAVHTLWRDHIRATLTAIKERGVLSLIDGVWLSPGEEGELCYQWDGIWAFDPHAIATYRHYLRRLYGDKIAALNADWASHHPGFEAIRPPSSYAPDREHWVFQDFYRWSMLRWCVQLADAVREVATPKHWLWLTHTLPDYPNRYHSARYAGFYIENLQRLGVADMVHIAALDWQGVQDVAHFRSLGVRVIGEIDVQPTVDRQRWTFDQSRKFGCDGVYLGTLENLSDGQKLSPVGEACAKLTREYRPAR